MKYTVHLPPEPLRDYVDHLWTVTVDGEEPPDLTMKFYATSAPCIVFQHRDGRSAITQRIAGGVREACNRSHPMSFIRGPITQPFHCIAEGAPTAIGIELKPQALNTLLRIDVSELRDELVELDEFSTANLNERLLNAKNRQDQIALLTRFLTEKAGAEQPRDELVAQSLGLIDQNVGSMHVRNLLKYLNVSERQFERRFARAVGVPASFYLRIVRFQETVRVMQAGRFDKLTDIAYDLGYTDQSHFIRDIKQFTGAIPSDLSHAVDESGATTRYRTLVRQRVLIQQDSLNPKARPRRGGVDV